MISITSACRAMSATSVCRSSVAVQMVAWMSRRGMRASSSAQISRKRAWTMVVWATTWADSIGGSASTSSSLSTAQAGASVQPSMPCTSGCSRSPTTISGVPPAEAARAMSWMRCTKGQVASMTSQPFASSAR